jgi:hypothetical protein
MKLLILNNDLNSVQSNTVNKGCDTNRRRGLALPP